MNERQLEFIRSWAGPRNEEYFAKLAELGDSEAVESAPAEPPAPPRRPKLRVVETPVVPIEPLGVLLDDVGRFVGRFVVMPGDAERIAVALWVAHSYVYDQFDATPYLAVLSPEKRSGKTRLLEVVGLLAREPQPVGGASLAALFRVIDERHPTLLLDEADTVFRTVRGEQTAEDIRGLLNNGYRRGQPYLRVVGEGKKMRVEAFDPFCPKAVAAIGRLPDTVLDRSVVIHLQRRRPDEPVEPFRLRRAAEEAAPLRERLAAALAVAVLAEDPPMPPGLTDRSADNWAPLLAIADAAGGPWPERARRAALVLTGGDPEDERTPVRLLHDIRVVFDEAGTDRLATVTLLEGLRALEESPWGDWRGKGLTPEGLAHLLREFRVRPNGPRIRARQMKLAGTKVRGFDRADFEDAWARYLVPDPVLGVEPGTPGTASTETSPEGTGLWSEEPNPVPETPRFEREVPGVPGYGGSTGSEQEPAIEDDLPPSAWDEPPPPESPPAGDELLDDVFFGDGAEGER